MKDWEKLPESKQEMALNFFMKCVGHLYLDYFQHHLKEAQQIGKEHAETLQGLMEPLEEEYIFPNWRRFKSMGSDSDLIWAEMCKVRTNIEAFQDMFGETTPPFGGVFMENFRDFMEAHKTDSMMLTEEEIPKNAPESHWWWFYKDEYTIERWERRERFLNDDLEGE